MRRYVASSAPSMRWRGVMGNLWSRFFPQKEQRRTTERQVVTAKQAATRELQRRRRSLDEAIAELKEIQTERGTTTND